MNYYLLSEEELNQFAYSNRGATGNPKLPPPIHIPSDEEIQKMAESNFTYEEFTNNHHRQLFRLAFIMGAKQVRDQIFNKTK